MRAVIVGAVPAAQGEEHYSAVLGGADLIVAADGGARLALALGHAPAVVVGDMDSIDAAGIAGLERAGVDIERHPTAKDESDLDLALRSARALGADAVTIIAAFGGRLDHTLAAIGTLMRASDMLADVREPDFDAWLVGGIRTKLHLTGEPGLLVSLISPQGAAGVSLSGLEYALDGDLPPMSSLGLSNRLLGSEATVSVRRGLILVVAWRDSSSQANRRVTAT